MRLPVGPIFLFLTSYGLGDALGASTLILLVILIPFTITNIIAFYMLGDIEND